ncbi:MAG: DUF5316 family protein [Bacillota bacterium]
MKHFVLGLVVAGLIALIAFLAEDWSLLFPIAGIVAVLALVWAIVTSITAGKQVKSSFNTTSERRRAQRERNAKVKNLVLFALPNLVAALIGLFILS